MKNKPSRKFKALIIFMGIMLILNAIVIGLIIYRNEENRPATQMGAFIIECDRSGKTSIIERIKLSNENAGYNMVCK